jgi:hypothetical protein
LRTASLYQLQEIWVEFDSREDNSFHEFKKEVIDRVRTIYPIHEHYEAWPSEHLVPRVPPPISRKFQDVASRQGRYSEAVKNSLLLSPYIQLNYEPTETEAKEALKRLVLELFLTVRSFFFEFFKFEQNRVMVRG